MRSGIRYHIPVRVARGAEPMDIVVRKRKDDGITEMFYTDDYQEAIRYAESMGASTELIDLSC